jgi:hypothetical protein
LIHATSSTSRPGSSGALPQGFREWERGVTYTVRPELLAPLADGREYRLNATLRRACTKEGDFTGYAGLYRRASTILDARVAAVARRNEGRRLHTWVLTHAWFRIEAGDRSFVSASITRALTLAGDGRHWPEGEETPSAEALQRPGGQSRDAYAARHDDDYGRRRLDEIYVEFEGGERSEAARDVTISYGEYIADPTGLDFAPYLQRAEQLAACYRDSATTSSHPGGTLLPVLMREWTCLDTSKTTDRRIVTVHLFLRM